MIFEICTKSTRPSIPYFNALFVRISILCFLLVAIGGRVLAADQKSNSNPCNVSAEDAAGLNGDVSTDVHATSNYSLTVAHILNEDKFEQLDCLADRARSGKETFSGGMWKLHLFYVGFYSPIQFPVTHATEEDWNMHLQRLRQWMTVRPKSVTARIALASAYIYYGWYARSNGTSDTVSRSGWKLFEEQTSEAKRILDEASTLPAKCPEWYVAMQNVARDQGWDVARARALYEEAVRFEPGYYYYPRILANYLLPKWAGKAGDAEKFIQEASDRIGGDQGDVLYFQIANNVICGCDGDPHLSMERIVRGFHATEKQYGVSMLNLNLIASVATKYGENDPIMADNAFARIGDQWDEATWEKKQDFDSAKQWAATWAPRMAERLAMETTAQANMQTAEGSHYKTAFEKTYRELVQKCVRSDADSDTPSEGKFETFTQVGAKGTIEADAIYAMNSVTVCVRRKLGLAWRDKSPVFAPPPQAPYWVALELDWADFVPVAAK